MLAAKLFFGLQMVASIIGIPYCFFIILAASKPGFQTITEEGKLQYLPIPLGIIALGGLALIFGRKIEGKPAKTARGWALGMMAIALLVTLLLFTELPTPD